MPSIVQAIRLAVNDAYKADPTLFDKLREGATKAGIIHQKYGFEVENPDQLFWLLHFNQGVEPKDTVWPAAEYGDFSEALSRITIDEQKVYLPFEQFPREIVGAPVTDIGILTLKEGVKVEEFKKIIDPFRASLAGKVPGYHGSAWSVDSTNDRKIFLFAGWDSIEAQVKFNETPEFAKYKSEAFPLFDSATPPKVLHVKFN
ncbi:hypothetical protein PILCRDRAFT_278443 [Piloderma croceum F 1598]|uniref:ABM domain-containing protein n=1 Tax=Piloderma croceum (strain F 1598) TaxID=765440 RepID=A0A0C3FTC1_PILCF|nr:hypothetical protein PILCRDRAFT_278443 [Piloderma croceum F 1598]